MVDNSEIQGIIEALTELNEDMTVPKNVKTRVAHAIEALKEDVEVSIKVDKAIQELDEISNDTNIQSYTRTQIWNVVSLLESTLFLF